MIDILKKQRKQTNKLAIQNSKQQLINSHKISILNLEINNLTVNELLTTLHKGVIFTPNVNHLMQLQVDSELQIAYQMATYKLCDSQVLIYASKFLGTPLKSKISGSDFLPLFCEYHRHNENIKIFLLGGADNISQQAQKKINTSIGRKIVVEAYSPSFGFEKNEEECQKILTMIRNSRANVLVVCLGCPKQEKWIAKYKNQLPNIEIFMGVGAAIDFLAGNKLRAPKWISNLGLEWLWRLLSEPRRLWKRYLLDAGPFLYMLYLQKMYMLYLQKMNRKI